MLTCIWLFLCTPPPRTKVMTFFVSLLARKWGPFFWGGGGLSIQTVSAPTKTQAPTPRAPSLEKSYNYATVIKVSDYNLQV